MSHTLESDSSTGPDQPPPAKKRREGPNKPVNAHVFAADYGGDEEVEAAKAGLPASARPRATQPQTPAQGSAIPKTPPKSAAMARDILEQEVDLPGFDSCAPGRQPPGSTRCCGLRGKLPTERPPLLDPDLEFVASLHATEGGALRGMTASRWCAPRAEEAVGCMVPPTCELSRRRGSSGSPPSAMWA